MTRLMRLFSSKIESGGRGSQKQSAVNSARVLVLALVGIGSITLSAYAGEITRGLQRTPLTAETSDGEVFSLYKGSYALLIGASRYQRWSRLTNIPSELDELKAALESQGFQVERLQDPDLADLRSGVQGFVNR